MEIGVIGIGVVGNAVKYGFEKLGHFVVVHDIVYNTKIEDVLNSELCFVCVPTPSKKSGACDISIVESVVKQLSDLGYKGVIVIKSTVIPGTTYFLQKKYSNLEICFVPEFLRERCAVTDFMENHDVCIIGTHKQEVFDLVKEAHGRYPKQFVKVIPIEAEFCKYFNNVYNATLITFANSFYEICKATGVDYSKVKDAMVKRDHITDIYLDCNENIRGFGGMCLPKDTKALAHLCKDLEVPVTFFQIVLDENDKYEVTVYGGMRK
jgi:UDPglucose 6-dehydrogenase